MRFIDPEHQQYYEQMNPSDRYHRALHYLIGLCPDTRRNAHELYDGDGIKPEAIYAGWQTSVSSKLTRLAFNLYTESVPTAFQFPPDGQAVPTTVQDFNECRQYSVTDIFCCEYALYFVEAIKLCYPEHCRDMITQKNGGNHLAR